ncbi:MAG: S41 family peptidase [Fimbriimonadaceae bacterium]|nr:hypothetical protein [Chthonomonadaceae bacterium]MCO5296013.1 S41 family peptidase [Fimbriimonadaceae bacterium]
MWTAVAVATGALLLAGGNAARDHVDVGNSRLRTASGLPLEGLVASKDQGPDVPEGAFFREMVELLKREYVDPISDESKLAEGAVRGMVQSLEDPECLFYDTDAFLVRRAELRGDYQGIGVDFMLLGDPALDATDGEDTGLGHFRVPRLVAAAVVPGGPADKAGVKPGDWVSILDGHWLVNTQEIGEYREAQKRFADGKMPKEAFDALRKEIQTKSEKNLMPMKALERLTQGVAGSLEIEWKRGNEVRKTTLTRARSHVDPVSEKNGTLSLRFLPDADKALQEAIAGKREVTLDLRGQVSGDFETMRRCLAVLAKKGGYGVLVQADGSLVQPLTVQNGNAQPPSLRLLVDHTTRDEAEIFALALAAFGNAKLVGEKTAGLPHAIETLDMAGGGGYSLVTGEYRREAARTDEVKS